MVDIIKHWLQHPQVKALAILGAALILALLVRFFIRRTVWRIVMRTETDIDDKFVTTFQFPLFLSFVFGGLWYAVSIFAIPESLLMLIRGVLGTVVVLGWMMAGLNFSGELVHWLSQSKNPNRLVQPKTRPIFQILFKLMVILVAAYFIILAWGQNLTGWLASAGVVGIAVGFASKDSLANLISGIFIIADSPYKLGDFIVLDNGETGKVTNIGIRSTRLLTMDDVEVIIPNSIMGNSSIINQSGGPYEKFRLKVNFGVAYGSDIDQVRDLVLAEAAKESIVEKLPAPRVRFREMADSALVFDLLVWIERPEIQVDVTDIMLTRIYKAFQKHDIEIPFPQMDIHVKGQ